MPQLFRIGPYLVYFWANENEPLEPIHVHIAEGRPQADGTKVWLTGAGHCVLSHNRSQIPANILRRMLQLIEANSEEIVEKWLDMFGEISYFC